MDAPPLLGKLGGFKLPELEAPQLPSPSSVSSIFDAESAPEPEEVAPISADPVVPVDGPLVGAGLAGAAVGGVLADVLTAGAGATLTGELLTDAAAVGAVALGGAAAYAATRPDEAGEAARFVGGAVANTTQAYAEVCIRTAYTRSPHCRTRASHARRSSLAIVAARGCDCRARGA